MVTTEAGTIVMPLGEVTIAAREGFEPPKLSAVNASSRLEVVVPLEGLIDVEAEKARLDKEIAKAAKEQKGLSGRLRA